jgi:hypothetical protein
MGILNCESIYDEIYSKFVPSYEIRSGLHIQLHFEDNMVNFVNPKADNTEWQVNFQAELCKHADEHFTTSLIKVSDELVNNQDALNVIIYCLNGIRRVHSREFYFRTESVNEQMMALRVIGSRRSIYSRLAEINQIFVQSIQVMRFQAKKRLEEELAGRYVYRIKPSRFIPKALNSVPIILNDFKANLDRLVNSELSFNETEKMFEIRPQLKSIDSKFDQSAWEQKIEKLIDRYENDVLVKCELSLIEAFGESDDLKNDVTLSDFKKTILDQYEKVDESKRVLNYKFLEKKRQLVVYGYRKEATNFAEEFVKPELAYAEKMNTLKVVFTLEKHFKIYIMLTEFKGKFLNKSLFHTFKFFSSFMVIFS